MRAFWLAVAAVFVALPALAHDVWLQPRNFWLPAPGPVALSILVGHGAARTPWTVDTARVRLLRSYGPGGEVDHRGELAPGPYRHDTPLRFATPGTQLLAMQSDYSSISDLPALRFNDYARTEGLTPAIQLRERNRATDTNGRERYGRCAKALIQIGPAGAGDQSRVTRPVGLPLEIVPERNPYTLRPGQTLPVRILYNGRPLAGALVKLNNLEFDLRPVAMHLSDAQGRAEFTLPRIGTWQLNVIWTRPISGDPTADFETTFSSLSFAYPPGSMPQ